MTREEWMQAHEIEKLEGGANLPIHLEALYLDPSAAFDPQILKEIRACWPNIAGSSYALIRVNNPHERN